MSASNKLFLLAVLLKAVIFAENANSKVIRGPVPIQADNFLTVSGQDFVYGGDEVYLSGTNPAWINYGNDFGNDQWNQVTGDIWRQEIEEIAAAGGNSVRVWVHVEGDQTPFFDGDGFVVGTDQANTLIPDLTSFLDVCQSNGVFLNLVLWNGALMRNQNYKNLFYDDSKLQSYLDNALGPMVEALRDHPALMAWEVINEPEGLVPAGQDSSEPCYNTTHLDYTHSHVTGGAGRAPGWAENLPMQNVLKFINWQASVIHQLDGKALVNVGSWSQYAQCDADFFNEDPMHKWAFNHYKDECLILAGTRPDGIMDFWQFHTYPYQEQWISGSPFLGWSVSDYEMDAPLVIGEFPAAVHGASEDHAIPGGNSTAELCEYLYTHDFNGGWSWFYGSDNTPEEDSDVLTGMEQLSGRTDHGKVEVDIA